MKSEVLGLNNNNNVICIAPFKTRSYKVLYSAVNKNNLQQCDPIKQLIKVAQAKASVNHSNKCIMNKTQQNITSSWPLKTKILHRFYILRHAKNR